MGKYYSTPYRSYLLFLAGQTFPLWESCLLLLLVQVNRSRINLSDALFLNFFLRVLPRKIKSLAKTVQDFLARKIKSLAKKNQDFLSGLEPLARSSCQELQEPDLATNCLLELQ